jgi:hypothetical protein
LLICVDTLETATMAAALRLKRCWEGRTSIRVGTVVSPTTPNADQVVIGRASVIRRALFVRWAAPYSGDEAARATELALSSAAWDGMDGYEPWRALSKPLPRAVHSGAPDLARDWVLIAPGIAAVPNSDVIARLERHLLEFPRRRESGSVSWWPSPRVAAYLLGRVVAVVAPMGPLAFDALRAGVPVWDPDTLEPSLAPSIDQRLAGLVPPSLIQSELFWRHIVEQTRAVAEGASPIPLCTPEWIALGRDFQDKREKSALGHTRRKLRKLWRDPQRFLLDSRHRPLRTVGNYLARSVGLSAK